MNVLLLTIAVCSGPPSEQWPGFRGDGTSVTADKDLPVQWSPNEGIAWRLALPGYGQSSPVAWNDGVYVTSVDGANKEWLIITRVSAARGAIDWSRTFSASQPGPNNPSMSRAASTPVADEQGIYAFFESGDVIALDHSGKTRWQRSLTKDYGDFKNHHGLGSSLAQAGSSLFVLADHSGPSYVLALDKATGTARWKRDRKSRLSWTTPVTVQVGGKALLLVSSNGSLDAYDASDGADLWSYGGLSGNLIPSPTVENDIMVIGAGESGLTSDMEAAAKSNCAIRLKRDGSGYEVMWEGLKAVAHHASPIVYRDRVYLVTKVGVVYCRELATGQELFRHRLDAPCWATPIAGDGRVYCFGKDGVTTVLAAGPTYEKIASNRLWPEADLEHRKENAKSSPINQFPPFPERGRAEMEAMLEDAVGDVVYGVAVSNRSFFIRTGNELFKIAK